MAELPYHVQRRRGIEARVLDAIEQKDLDNHQPTPERVLRMSSIGRCPRELWAGRNDIPEERPFDQRVRTLFRLGHHVEELVVEHLNDAGLIVSDQQRTVDIEVGGGRLLGHIDGIVTVKGDRYLLEIKTANERRFDELDRDNGPGYQAWGGSAYSSQLHAYMGGLGLAAALAVVYCKNDSRIYIEKVPFDSDIFLALLVKGQEILEADADDPPDRPSAARSKSNAFCRWCTYNEWCWSPVRDAGFDD